MPEESKTWRCGVCSVETVTTKAPPARRPPFPAGWTTVTYDGPPSRSTTLCRAHAVEAFTFLFDRKEVPANA